ncbi:MAG TPA: hypothetical protein VN830_03840 [Verrucomicrobiae bacterium]|nr:hypothetical protein [Verrucomicrobiae bacterium]
MSRIRSPQGAPLLRLRAAALGLLMALPAWGYDFPLSSSAIRDAYFLGNREGGMGSQFLANYRHPIPELHVAEFTSFVQIETPFAQVALHSSRKLNYSAQDAVREFSGRPMPFHIHMEINYMPDAPPEGIKVKLIQGKKEIVADYVERSLFYPPTDVYTRVPSIGEILDLELKPEKIDSSTLTIQIDTPDGQHAECVFEMQEIR